MKEIYDDTKAEINAEIIEKKDDVNEKDSMEEIVRLDKEKGEGEKQQDKYENLYYKKKKQKHHFFILIIILIILLLVVGVFSTIFAIINKSNNRILGGISVKNISIEGMTEDEAVRCVTEKFEQEKNKEIPLIINGESFSISGDQIEIQYEIDEAVKNAYNVGRTGNIFQNNFNILQTMFEKTNFDVDITYNEELLEEILSDMGAKIPNVMVDNSYYVEDGNLFIVKGVDGVQIDLESAKEEIINSLKEGRRDTINIKTEFAECPEIDLNKIHDEVKCEPQNASYKTNPFEIIPHKVGLDFDIESAQELLKENKEEYKIKLTIIEPEIHTNEIGEEAFPDLLASFSTKYDETNVSRSTNLKIAMSKLNGVVIMPGEVFSYNKTLGKRTVEEGYKEANGFAGGKVVPMLAGGICQISSTLYDAALYANLNIVERHNHMFQATYVEPGKDATVVYGSLDFKFENTRSYPIMLKTKCGGGLADIKIFGNKEEVEYDIEIITSVSSYTPYGVVYQDDYSLAPGVERVSQYGLQGCKSTTYRIKKLNGQEVSKEVLSTDTYSPLNKIIRRGVAVAPAPIVEEIPQAEAISEPVPENPSEVQPESETVTNNQESEIQE